MTLSQYAQESQTDFEGFLENVSLLFRLLRLLLNLLIDTA